MCLIHQYPLDAVWTTLWQASALWTATTTRRTRPGRRLTLPLARFFQNLQKWPKTVQKCPRVVQIHISSVFDRYSSFGSLLDRFGHFWRKKTGSGSCHSPLGRVRQPLWDQVQEKYWPNKVTSRASISQEKAN